MKTQKNALKVLCSLLLVATAGVMWNFLFGYESVWAYSASISASESIEINLTPMSDDRIGASVARDDLGITTTCRAGYTLTVSTPTDNNLYLNGDKENNSERFFSAVDGVSSLNSQQNLGKWGYAMSFSGLDDVFLPITGEGATLLTPKDTKVHGEDIDETVSVYYGSTADYSMPIGSYTFDNSDALVYQLTMDPSCTTYTIQYDGSAAENTDGMGVIDSEADPEYGVKKTVRQTNIPEDASVTLLASNFKNSGFGFLGWSLDSFAYEHLIDDDSSNDPVIYGPNQTIVVDSSVIAFASEYNIITMYAVWLPALTTNDLYRVYLQDWNGNTQVTINNGEYSYDVVALTDKRDNEVYAVSCDQLLLECRMMENLRLLDEYTSGYNINDSSVTNQSLSQGYADDTPAYGRFVGLAESEDYSAFGGTDSNSIYNWWGGGSSSEHIDIVDVDEPEYRIPRYNAININATLTSPEYVQDYSDPLHVDEIGAYGLVYSYGNYYSWSAAMATTLPIEYSASQYAGTSICPKGWKLPVDTIPSSRELPYSYIMSDSNYPGSVGEYWTSSSVGNSAASAVVVSVDSEYVIQHGTSRPRYSGLAVRCMKDTQDVNIVFHSNIPDDYNTINVYASEDESMKMPMQSFYYNDEKISFNGWNSQPDGMGTHYDVGDTYIVPSLDVDFYAEWVRVEEVKFYIDENESDGFSLTFPVDSNGFVGVTFPTMADLEGYNVPEGTLSGWVLVEDSSMSFSPGSYHSFDLNTFSYLTFYGDWSVVSPYSIRYDGNGADNSEYGLGRVNDETGLNYVRQTHLTVNETSVTLLPSTFKRDGYGFAGWSLNQFADPSKNDDSEIYGPNEQFMLTAEEGQEFDNYVEIQDERVVTLYAVWVEAAQENDQPLYLQDWNGCSSMDTNSVIALTDKRDGEVYTVTKTGSGKCWMMENLRLDDAATKGENKFDSNILNSDLAQGYGSSYDYGSFVGLADSENMNFDENYSSNSLYSMYMNDNMMAIGDYNFPRRIPRYNNSNIDLYPEIEYVEDYYNSNNVQVTGSFYDEAIIGLGNYYSWSSAIANTDDISQSDDYNTESTSICPAGWRLPSGGTGYGYSDDYKDFVEDLGLYDAREPQDGSYYNYYYDDLSLEAGTEASREVRRYPYNFVYSGRFVGDSKSDGGEYGYYWTSTSSSLDGQSMTFQFSNNTLFHGTGVQSRWTGLPIRCIRDNW